MEAVTRDRRPGPSRSTAATSTPTRSSRATGSSGSSAPGFGEGLFSEWRESSDFVLNQAQYEGDDTILVAGPNFGTGSSREHAPWALEDYGFRRRDLAPLRRHLPQQLPEDRAAAGGAARRRRRRGSCARSRTTRRSRSSIDVVDRRVAVPAIDLDEPFDLDDFHHYRLLEGLDDIGLTLRHTTDIDAFEAQRPTYTPRVVAA